MPDVGWGSQGRTDAAFCEATCLDYEQVCFDELNHCKAAPAEPELAQGVRSPWVPSPRKSQGRADEAAPSGAPQATPGRAKFAGRPAATTISKVPDAGWAQTLLDFQAFCETAWPDYARRVIGDHPTDLESLKAASAQHAATAERLDYAEKLFSYAAGLYALELAALKSTLDKHPTDLETLKAASADKNGTLTSSDPARTASPLRELDFENGTLTSANPACTASPLRELDFENGTPTPSDPAYTASPLRERPARPTRLLRRPFRRRLLRATAHRHRRLRRRPCAKHAKESADQHASELGHPGKDQQAHRANIDERVSYLEKLLNDSADKRAAELQALKDANGRQASAHAKHAKNLKTLQAADAKKTKKLAAELTTGRLAMMVIIGRFFQDGLTGSAWRDRALYTASPLRAFEYELGEQVPVDLYDLTDFPADGDTENVARRRQTMTKHGRIDTLAAMDYVSPEITSKLPGDLSPSASPLRASENEHGVQVPVDFKLPGYPSPSASLKVTSPLRAFENEFGVQVPVDIYDADGFAAEGNNENFARRRKTRIKHGCIDMLAAMGYPTPEITPKLPGYLWPSASLKVASPLRAFENEPGAQVPVDVFAADGNAENPKRRRQTVIKPGCIAAKLPSHLSPRHGPEGH